MPPASSPWRMGRIAGSSTSRPGRSSAGAVLARGATTLYAQVAAANQASRALQEGLGMREAYRYRYLIRS